MQRKIILSVLLCLLSSFAMGQQDIWYWRDGEFYKGESVDSITFTKPGDNGHTAVDMGLSVKWAACNVGASAPWETGDYYAWGETEVKGNYSWSTYEWGTGTDHITKYCTQEANGNVDGLTRLKGCDDAARINMGGAWRMPTEAELLELLYGCYWEWTADYDGHGIAGFIVYKAKDDADKGKKKYPEGHFLDKGVTLAATYTLADTHLFLPAAGMASDKIYNVNEAMVYWTASVRETDNQYAVALSFNSSDLNKLGWARDYGFNVRAVLQE